MDTIQNGIANRLRGDAELMELLPGGVWTRPIRMNENGPGLPPTPGSTPDAFDHAGRIRRCASVLNGEAPANPLGPVGAYMAQPEIYLRCLPHESDKHALNLAAERIIALLQGYVLTGLGGEGVVLSVAGRMMPDDDPVLTPAVVDMIRVAADGVWRA